jgi:putative transcriptional regulator
MTFSRSMRPVALLGGWIGAAAVVALLLGLTSVDRMAEQRLADGPARAKKLEAGVFLVATQRIGDPRFSRSVILLTHTGVDGALGVIINRPTDHRLSDLLPEIEALEGRSDLLFFGGPVSLDSIVMLVLSLEKLALAHTTRVFGNVYFSGNPEAFSYILGRKKEEEAIRGYAGYAGWGPGQLEAEINRGDWTIADGDAATVFREDPSTVWKDLAPEPESERELRAAR